MTLLGPDGIPIQRVATNEKGELVQTVDPLPASDFLTREQIVQIRIQGWRDTLPGEQLCGAAIVASELQNQYRTLAQAGRQSDAILNVFGQMLHDVVQAHGDHHASDVVVEATATSEVDQ